MLRFIYTLGFLSVLATGITGQRPNSHTYFDPIDVTGPRTIRPTADGPTFRLPNDTRPIRYDIDLQTWIDQGRFDFLGEVKIHLKIVAPHTNTITVHSFMQTIFRTELRTLDGRVIPTWPHQYDPVFEFLTVQTRSGFLLEHDQYILEVDYTGILRSDDQGFYRSSYVNEQDQIVWLATTQFQAIEARHAFPCYDEPGIRAVYGLTLRHASHYHALANMPIKSMTTNNMVTTTIFEDTPIMQTYLNAFIVSDFANITNADTKGPDELLQRVFGQPATIARGEADFALEAGVKILKAMEDYFDYPYILPKMDQIGIPTFYFGAMENWGLVTYRESALYYNPETSAMSQKDGVARIVSHEYAHQFFGNTVSPQWWEFIWLNEGFATLYAYHAVHLVYPEWRVTELMEVQTCQSVMEMDAYETTRPMNYYVEDSALIMTVFDSIAYSKSGCVLKMVQHFLSDDTFAKGLSAYLHRMEFRAVNPDDLYSSLHEVSIAEGAIPAYLSIKEIMNSWANQKGFPFLTVERLPNGLLSVTQDRFLLRALPTSEPQTWWVPFNIATKSSPNFDRTTPEGWIPHGTRTITVRPSGAVTWDSDDWIVFNKQGSGYYRVNYDAHLWELVTQELVDGDFTQIHILNRAQLIDDAYHFARVMLVDYDVVLGLMEYLSHELEYPPWVSANRPLTTIDRMIASLEYYDQFRTFVLNSVTPIFDKLGVRNIDNEPYFDRLARNVAVRWACYMGSNECQEATTDRIREYVTTEQQFEADNRNTIMCAGMRNAGYDEGFGLWLKMQASTVTATRYEIIDALVCSQNNELLQQLMGTLIVSLGVNYSTAEKTRLMSGVANSGIVGTMAVMQFIEANMEEINDRIPLGQTINNMASWISNQGTFMRFSSLLNELYGIGTITATQRTSAQNTVISNMEWVADYGRSIMEFLNNYTARL